MLTGAVMVVAGIGMLMAGLHGVLADALAPFGVGLMLSEGIGRAAKAASERLKVRIRHDEE